MRRMELVIVRPLIWFWVPEDMTGVEAPLVHAGIVLTVTGVSRCISLEAYASASLIPLVTGYGVAVAFDAPIVAEACGLGSIAAAEDVDVKVVGRGLYYSTRGVERGLADLAARLYSSGEDSVRLPPLPVSSFELGYPAEALVASLRGSSAIIGGYAFPLSALQGYWLVAARLRHPMRTDKVVEALYTGRLNAEELVVEIIDEGVEGLSRAGLALAQHSGRQGYRLVRKALRLGADAAFIDSSGRMLIAVVEDPVTVSMLSSKLRSLGDRYEAEIIA